VPAALALALSGRSWGGTDIDVDTYIDLVGSIHHRVVLPLAGCAVVLEGAGGVVAPLGGVLVGAYGVDAVAEGAGCVPGSVPSLLRL
jgi:hypothetical protein